MRFLSLQLLLLTFACCPLALAQRPAPVTASCSNLLQQAEQEVERNAEAALHGSEEAIALAQVEGDDRCQVEALIMRARAQRYLGQLNQASAALREAIIRAEDERLPDLKALAQARLGQALEADGNLDQAMVLLTEAVQDAEPYPEVKAHALNLLGHVYQVAQRYPEAERSYQQSLDLYREQGDSSRTASVLLNLAVAARATGKLGEADSLSRLALKQFEQNGDPRGIASALNNLGQIQEQRGDLDLAMNSHREALVQRQRLKDGLGTSISRTSLAKVLLARAAVAAEAQTAARMRREAIELLEKAAEYKRSEQTRPSLMDTMRLLASAYAIAGDPASAYARMQDFAQLQQEVFNDDANRRFAEISQRFELDRKAAELERAKLAARAAESEAQSQTRLLVVLGMTCLLAFVALAGMALIGRARQRTVKTSDELRSAERLLIAAISNAPTGIIVVGRDDRILKLNNAALQILGLDHEATEPWAGRPVDAIRDRLAFTDPDGRPIERAQLPLALVFREGRASEQRELVVLDGREGRRILAGAAPVFDSSDRLTAAVLAMIDITELRMIESQQDQLRIRLTTAERSEAIHLALGGLAHEFSNQLGVAIGYAELLPDSDDGAVDELRLALNRSNDLVRQLQLLAGYALTRPSALKPTEIAQQVAEAFAVVRPEARLELELERDLPLLQGDAKLLRQALSELLSNALESGPNAALIRLRVAAIDDPSQVAGVAIQRCEASAGYVLFTVSDEGCGMSEQTRKRAFDPYFSGRPGGRGMGLSLVAGILRAHHGGIYLDTTPQAGTRISILLPASGSVAALGRPLESARV